MFAGTKGSRFKEAASFFIPPGLNELWECGVVLSLFLSVCSVDGIVAESVSGAVQVQVCSSGLPESNWICF